jgi:hypothetical protein
VDLACGHAADIPDSPDPAASVFLDIKASLTILKFLLFAQALTSIQEVPNGERPQNVQVLVLMGPFPFCRLR